MPQSATILLGHLATPMSKVPKGQPPHETQTGLDSKLARPNRKRLTAAEKRERKAQAIQLFVKQSGRQAQKRTEPNDRRYSHEIQKAVGLMDPIEFYELLKNGKED
jgi:hypothetical protein